MDWVNIRGHTEELLKKYRYGILILLVGVVLMCLPGKNTDEPVTHQPMTAVLSEQQNLERSLAAILSQIHGAGKVEVLLTEAKGTETMYQSTTTSSNDSLRHDAVIITGTDRSQSGLIQQIVPPTYLGAVIVCQGANSAAVRLSIVQAVSSVTGLGSDRITVLKMK